MRPIPGSPCPPARSPKSLKTRASADAVSPRRTPPASMRDTPAVGSPVTVSGGRTIAVTGRDTPAGRPPGP